MFHKVLVANRGEIAVRIIRTLREMGIISVAAFSDADRQALFVQEADESYRLGPAQPSESYLNVDSILSVARQANVEAIHPGYGFLAENSDFAEAVAGEGITFIGPSPKSVRFMGDKVLARQAVQELGVVVVPGTPGPVANLSDAIDFGKTAGYPIAVKAAGGGGGRGIRIVQRHEDMPEALEAASREADTYFKNPVVYLERYFPDPRHVEVQVLGDCHGGLIHLGERDCSVQRRHQKLIEETPSPVVDSSLRARMGEMALRAARSADYFSAGTVEFLVTPEREFYFLEMNTRIQVEHPITEQVSGIDLIREMILVAAGEHMTSTENLIEPRGHAIEIRVNAEDPMNDFRPTPATISTYREPGGPGVRMDSGVYAGYTIPENYDSLISKLIVWSPDRESARRRALRSIDEYEIDGPSTTLPFARAVLEHPTFVSGDITTAFVSDHLANLQRGVRHVETVSSTESPGTSRSPERTFEVEVNKKLFRVQVAELKSTDRRERKAPQRSAPSAKHVSGTLNSSMHGSIVSIKKKPGEAVAEGETLFIIEAMKMENEVAAHRSGKIASIAVTEGQTVDTDQQLAVIE